MWCVGEGVRGFFKLPNARDKYASTTKGFLAPRTSPPQLNLPHSGLRPGVSKQSEEFSRERCWLDMHLNLEILTPWLDGVLTLCFITHTQTQTQTRPTEPTKFLKAHQVATAASSKPLPTPASETESLVRSSAALPYSGSLQSPPPGHRSEPSGAISLPNLKQTCRRTGNKRLKKTPQRHGQD